MTEEIRQLINDRAKFKNINENSYKELNRLIRTKIKKAKIDYLNKQCLEIESLQAIHDDFNLHKKLKEASGIYKKRVPSQIINNYGNPVFETNLGLKINIKKTKFMVVSRKNFHNNVQLTLDNAIIERVRKYKYLGCWLNSEWSSSQEIKCRIEYARTSFIKFKKTLTTRNFVLLNAMCGRYYCMDSRHGR